MWCAFLELQTTKEKAFPELSWKGIEFDWHNLTRFRRGLWSEATSVCGQQVLSVNRNSTGHFQRWEGQRCLFSPSVFLNKDIQGRAQPGPQLPPKWPIQWFGALTKITVNPHCVLWLGLKCKQGIRLIVVVLVLTDFSSTCLLEDDLPTRWGKKVCSQGLGPKSKHFFYE